MNKHISEITIYDMYPIMLEKIESGGTVEFKPYGTSMLPLIVAGRDSVILKKPPEKLKRLDIAFYKRANGQLVLHRIVGKGINGTYTMCGDNQNIYEKGIKREQIFAVVDELVVDGKHIKTEDAEYRKQSADHVAKVKRTKQIQTIKRTIKKILHMK